MIQESPSPGTSDGWNRELIFIVIPICLLLVSFEKKLVALCPILSLLTLSIVLFPSFL